MPIAPEHLALLYTGPFYAYLYGRNSNDPTKKGSSVKDQNDEGRELCLEQGWPIRREFADVGRSASRYAKREREEFEEMIEGIEAGDCRIVVAWEASRYYRDLDVYVRLRAACMNAGVLLCYNGAVYDLSKRADRKLTAQDALQAEDEAEGIRDRNLRTARRNATKGRPHGRITYGYARRYDPDTGDLVAQYAHPERAPIVLDVFKRIAAGETSYAVLQRLRATGDRMPGYRWEAHHLIAMLRNPAYKGRRVYQGKDVGKAIWPAIVPDDLFDAVLQIVSAPERQTADSFAAVHLLSGIARCGECENSPHLRVCPSRGALQYQCSDRFDTAMAETKLDAYIEEAVITFLESKAAAAAFLSTEDQSRAAAARVRKQQMETQLAEARTAAATMTDAGTPLLSIASLAVLENELGPKIEKARKAAESLNVPPVLRGIIGQPNVDEIWEAMSMDQRRAVLRAVVNIRLMKARARGLRAIEPGRIQLTFYGEPGFIRGWRRGRALPQDEAGQLAGEGTA
ncbi:recombinase family protein [Streptomyces sp. NBC_00247]|uniref:recombinase family protein n=1 Tax=Streptomyces sp. NBC_00247 TaxID=2975689 RepID=UPI002E2A866B|nr:recombinase family protein [Streptomyces sp. NBC_00247]